MYTRTDKLTDNVVFKEVLSTEETFNKSLKFLSLSLFIQLQFQEDPLFREFHTLVEQFIEVSDGLTANVESSLNNTDNPETRQTLKDQRAQLLERFFGLYQSYEKLFKRYAALCKENPEHFKQINFYMTQNHDNKLGFDPHVIMPVQRGPRYLLLVKELMKHDKGCDDFNKEEFVQLERQFDDSLSVFSSKKSETPTPQVRPYQFGDYTLSFFGLRNTNEQGSSTSLTCESKKQDEVVVTSPEVSTESKSQNSSPKGYRFGDLSRRLWGANTNTEKQTTTVVNSLDDTTTKKPEDGQKEVEKVTQQEVETVKQPSTPPQGYQFGDFTRRLLIWGANKQTQAQTTTVVHSVDNKTTENLEESFVEITI